MGNHHFSPPFGDFLFFFSNHLNQIKEKVSAGMDRKVLIYSATEHFDDMPVGDKDDDEESRLAMKQVAGTIGPNSKCVACFQGINSSTQ